MLLYGSPLSITAKARLKAMLETAHIPIIAQSAEPINEYPALAAGAHAFFVKPTSIDVLLTTIRSLLTERS